MSIIKPIHPTPQRRTRSDADDKEREHDKALFILELLIVVVVAWAGFSTLGLIGHFFVSEHSARIKFVTESSLALFTLLAVVFQAVVYRRQWNAMRASLKQTDKVIAKMQLQFNEIQKQSGILDKTLAETAKIAVHSERSVEVARENTEYAQRAYVSITHKDWTGTGFSLGIENSGNTPAREVMVSWFIDAGGSPPAGFPKLGDPNPKYPESLNLGLLAPRSPEGVFVPCNRSLTTKEEEDYREWPDIYHWWVRGSIFYRDVFQDPLTGIRVTDFCFFYDQKAQAVRAHYEGNEEKEEKSKPSPN